MENNNKNVDFKLRRQCGNMLGVNKNIKQLKISATELEPFIYFYFYFLNLKYETKKKKMED